MGQNLSILLYSSQKQVSVGDIVEISIRNNLDYGLILSENVEEKIKYENVTITTILPQKTLSAQRNSLTLKEEIVYNKTTKSETLSKTFEIKEINKILPIKLSIQQIQFLKIFADNTFNSLNDTWDALTVPFGLLTQKQWLELENSTKSYNNNLDMPLAKLLTNPLNALNDTQSLQNSRFIEDKIPEVIAKDIISSNDQIITPKVEFLINLDIKVRIMYIIRSLMGTIQTVYKGLEQGTNKQLLIVFPEKKYLNKIYKYLQTEIAKDKELSAIVELLYYASEPTKKPKECIWSMLSFKSIKTNSSSSQTTQIQNTNINPPKLQIICSTRSGLFLPFSNLTDIVLIDEGNSMYIQDQNSLYYDTREAIFLISKAFNANILFISHLPSIRLYNMYNKKTFEQQMVISKQNNQKPLKIKITRFDKKSSKYDLFGYEIEQILEDFPK